MKWYSLPVITAASIAATMAGAADLANKKAPAAPPPPPAWLDTLTIDGYVEGGVAMNFNQPWNGINWGHLYTDRANTPTFNGAVLTVQRPLDPKSDTYDFGFKAQVQLGEDMRYNHLTGTTEYWIKNRTQVGPLEANVQAHLPWKTFLSQGGIDVKAGIFPTYNGAEVMYAKDNLFYSHSYIFNFGPFLHTGVMTTTHVREWLDVYAGVTTGVNTFIGWPGDNNGSPSFHGGFGLNLLDGNLTILGIVHHGPENPKQIGGPYDPGFGFPVASWPNTPFFCVCNPNSTARTYANLTTTWKVTENLTLITDMAFNRERGWNPASALGNVPQNSYGLYDQFFPNFVTPGGWPTTVLSYLPQHPKGAESYAIAQYASYKVNDIFKINGRVEYYRDANNFFVSAFPGYFDAINFLHGFYCPSCIARPANVGTSYLALTAGMTITPELPKLPIITGLILRPEVRWDTAVNGTTPFFRGLNYNGNGQSRSQGMFNMDVIIPFSLL
ncbi:MAG: outer membrane beta-barrel protein [Methylocystis sp.]|uniref:outer membrane beta-barrel protein n=1 Tax=Methylocystis sp. TaxID=1911079 RepID=UPI003DA2FAB3